MFGINVTFEGVSCVADEDKERAATAARDALAAAGIATAADAAALMAAVLAAAAACAPPPPAWAAAQAAAQAAGTAGWAEPQNALVELELDLPPSNMSEAEYAIEDSISTDSTILIEYSAACYNELLATCEDYHVGDNVTTFWGKICGLPWQVDMENEY